MHAKKVKQFILYITVKVPFLLRLESFGVKLARAQSWHQSHPHTSCVRLGKFLILSVLLICKVGIITIANSWNSVIRVHS